MSRVHLVSFADGYFADRSANFQFQASSIQIFNSITIYNIVRLPTDFASKHGKFMRSAPRGFGYWIWKPIIILEMLEQAQEDDIVVYLDVGFTLNKHGRRRMDDYLEIARCSPDGMLSFQNVHTEKSWTKMDLAIRLDVQDRPHIMATSQLSSGFLIIQKNRSNIELICEWSRLSVEDNYRYSDDSPSSSCDDESFKEHRHDQSISSILRKMRGTTIAHYEVQPYDTYFEELKPSLPALATRLRQ